jgi:hypothetical protein
VEDFCNNPVQDSAGRNHRFVKEVVSGEEWSLFRTEAGELARVLNIASRSKYEAVKERIDWIARAGDTSGLLAPSAVLVLPSPHVGYTFAPIVGALKLSRWLGADSATPFLLSARLRLGCALARTIGDFNRLGLGMDGVSPEDFLLRELGDGTFSIWFTRIERLVRIGSSLQLDRSAPYGAPENNRGTHLPDALSNNFSLAQLLFALLRLAHPFRGGFESELGVKALRHAERGDLPDIDHPDHPHYGKPRLLAAWTCTQMLQDLFSRSFGDGLRFRSLRPSPDEFAFACSLAERQTVACYECKSEFYGNGTGPQTCIWCQTRLPKVPQLAFFDVVHRMENGTKRMSYRRLLERRVYLRPGLNLVLATHLERRTRYSSNECFTIENEVGRFVLRNTSLENLRVSQGPKKGIKDVKTGGNLELYPGYQLYFDKPTPVLGVEDIFKQPATISRVCKFVA